MALRIIDAFPPFSLDPDDQPGQGVFPQDPNVPPSLTVRGGDGCFLTGDPELPAYVDLTTETSNPGAVDHHEPSPLDQQAVDELIGSHRLVAACTADFQPIDLRQLTTGKITSKVLLFFIPESSSVTTDDQQIDWLRFYAFDYYEAFNHGELHFVHDVWGRPICKLNICSVLPQNAGTALTYISGLREEKIALEPTQLYPSLSDLDLFKQLVKLKQCIDTDSGFRYMIVHNSEQTRHLLKTSAHAEQLTALLSQLEADGDEASAISLFCLAVAPEKRGEATRIYSEAAFD